MPRKVYPPKDPDETLPYGFNWTPRNIGEQQITSIDVDIVSGTITNPSNAVDTDGSVIGARQGQGSVHVFAGGTPGETCEILYTVETDGGPPTGSLLQQTVYLPIREK